MVAPKGMKMENAGNEPPRTVSDGVKDSYYGIPAVKAPHWRWLVILYFFFGGMAGASFTIGTVANLVSEDKAIERAARYITMAALLPCPPLLILDLGRPERFMNMLRVIKLKSPMSLGSWALSGLGAAATAAAGVQLLCDVTGRDRFPGIRRAIGIAGLPFSIFLSGYTGVLLAVTNIPVWWRAFAFLSPTFVSSAYATALTAIATVLNLSGHTSAETHRRLARAEAICAGAELTGLTLMLLRLGRFGRPLRAGKVGLFFWPITVVSGILVPLGLQLSGPARGIEVRSSRRWIAAGLTMVGGVSLRAVMIFAGRESANRPEDYFALTRGVRSGQ
jgi:formate-dependent nitrite reductase membrane component NrfD